MCSHNEHYNDLSSTAVFLLVSRRSSASRDHSRSSTPQTYFNLLPRNALYSLWLPLLTPLFNSSLPYALIYSGQYYKGDLLVLNLDGVSCIDVLSQMMELGSSCHESDVTDRMFTRAGSAEHVSIKRITCQSALSSKPVVVVLLLAEVIFMDTTYGRRWIRRIGNCEYAFSCEDLALIRRISFPGYGVLVRIE
ncbi:hypothetical protein Tco_0455514 [Tanacetum coccineum]